MKERQQHYTFGFYKSFTFEENGKNNKNIMQLCILVLSLLSSHFYALSNYSLFAFFVYFIFIYLYHTHSLYKYEQISKLMNSS